MRARLACSRPSFGRSCTACSQALRASASVSASSCVSGLVGVVAVRNAKAAVSEAQVDRRRLVRLRAGVGSQQERYRKEGGSDQAGERMWITRLASNSFVFAP